MTEHTVHEVTEKRNTSPGEMNQAVAFQRFLYASMDAYINLAFMPLAYYRRVLDIAGSVALRRSATLRARGEDEEEWIIGEEVEPIQQVERELAGVR